MNTFNAQAYIDNKGERRLNRNIKINSDNIDTAGVDFTIGESITSNVTVGGIEAGTEYDKGTTYRYIFNDMLNIEEYNSIKFEMGVDDGTGNLKRPLPMSNADITIRPYGEITRNEKLPDTIYFFYNDKVSPFDASGNYAYYATNGICGTRDNDGETYGTLIIPSDLNIIEQYKLKITDTDGNYITHYHPSDYGHYEYPNENEGVFVKDKILNRYIYTPNKPFIYTLLTLDDVDSKVSDVINFNNFSFVISEIGEYEHNLKYGLTDNIDNFHDGNTFTYEFATSYENNISFENTTDKIIIPLYVYFPYHNEGGYISNISYGSARISTDDSQFKIQPKLEKIYNECSGHYSNYGWLGSITGNISIYSLDPIYPGAKITYKLDGTINDDPKIN